MQSSSLKVNEAELLSLFSITHTSLHTRAIALASHIAGEQSGNFLRNHSEIYSPVVEREVNFQSQGFKPETS